MLALALPLLAAAGAWGLRLRRVASSARPLSIGAGQWLLALPAVGLLSPVIALLCVVFGLGLLSLVALLLGAVLLGLLLPVLLLLLRPPAGSGRPATTSWALPALALGAALLALGIGHGIRPLTAGQPQQTHLFYAPDAARHRAYWLAAAPRPDAWTSRVLTRPQPGPLPAALPQLTGPVLHQAAPALPLAPPTITVLDARQVAGGRLLRLRLLPGRPLVSSLALTVAAGGRLRALRAAGQLVPAADLAPVAGPVRLVFFVPRPAGELIELEAAGPGALQVAVATSSLGLPAAPGLPALPPQLVPAPGYNSFTTQVSQDFRL